MILKTVLALHCYNDMTHIQLFNEKNDTLILSCGYKTFMCFYYDKYKNSYVSSDLWYCHENLHILKIKLKGV